jgi:hypothetical protein
MGAAELFCAELFRALPIRVLPIRACNLSGIRVERIRAALPIRAHCNLKGRLADIPWVKRIQAKRFAFKNNCNPSFSVLANCFPAAATVAARVLAASIPAGTRA